MQKYDLMCFNKPCCSKKILRSFMDKFVYLFNEAHGLPKDLLGGKGFGLVKMSSIGLSVPPGFIITTQACKNYYLYGEEFILELKSQVKDSIRKLENLTNRHLYRLDDKTQNFPLFLSARSGAKISMPGMMDTILNIGINKKSSKILSDKIGNSSFPDDIHIRFMQMFLNVCANIPNEELTNLVSSNSSFDEKLDLMSKLYEKKMNQKFPEDPYEHLYLAIEGVFKSWNNERAIYYRKVNGIPDDIGTAVTIQMMVFGNLGENSGTGVAFSRNPMNGENEVFGEYLSNAQGEDVVAGVKTPSHISSLKNIMPDVYDEFIKSAKILEDYFGDMQDMEFTVENGKLYILQTRNGKRSADASVKISLDLLKEGKISEQKAINMVSPLQIQNLLHSKFDSDSIKKAKLISKGLPASPGASVGKVVFDSETAKKYHESGEKVILVRNETSAEDIEGMSVSEGILTVHGGMTSHAAVVARGMGKCCVSGCEEISIFEDYFVCAGNRVNKGDVISIDGTSGNIYLGEIKVSSSSFSGDVVKFLEISDKFKKISVMSNADNPKSVSQAISMGALGVGLCRTEHMFFESDRINFMREMIISKDLSSRKKALDKLFKFQKEDFKGMFEAANGLPVTIRLLDPPLHEFLPESEDEILSLASDLGVDKEYIKEISSSLKEFNPMMGHRGCRLLISYPEIAQMQVRAILVSSIEVSKSKNYKIVPEIMVPLVGDVNEIRFLKNIINDTSKEVMKENNFELEYKIGTMIEIPRACLLSGEIAKEVDFFSFGTNDLTQMTFGFSRDDSQKFLKDYYKNGIYSSDPFAKIDTNGVGELMKIAINLGKNANKNLKIGVCGEHAGDPDSIKFFRTLGIDYVSCSPFRVPVARLSSAQD